jgi:hypothetical protein
MTKRQKNFWTGAVLLVLVVVVLSLPQCKGLCRSIAAQVESTAVADMLAGLFG